MLHFILSIPVIMLFIFYYGLRPSAMWLIGIPLLLIIQFVITFGISIAIAAVNLFFRDMERIVFIFTTLLFYITPIIYSADLIPDKYKSLILLNPLTVIMVSWRDLFMNGVLDFRAVTLSFMHSLVFLIVGYLIYRRLSWKFAEVL
jgi:lipopolysaccharide transport system permease protein